MLATTATVGIVIAILAVAIRAFTARGKTRKMPPGPKGLPILGNVGGVATSHPHLYYTELNKKYGEIASISVLGQPVILLGSYEVANQLLMKRGTIYSSRPISPFSDHFFDLEHLVPVTPYGPIWKEERRIYHDHLSTEVTQTWYRPDIEADAFAYVLKSIESEKNISTDYEEFAMKTLINAVYGIKVTSREDKVLDLMLRGTDVGSATLIPGKFLVNVFPSLLKVPSWFPGTGWQKTGRKYRQLMLDMVQVPYNRVKEAEKEGHAKQSFALSMIRDDTTLDEANLMKTSGSAFIAGAEPVAAMAQYFIYAMLKHPEVYKKAQQEVDNVIGNDRLPTIDDAPNLPYIDAVIKELMRWLPASPVSVPHLNTEDDIYNGYFIPKNSVVIQNTWAISRDESIYEKPDEFNPERFLVAEPPLDPRLWLFGVGRRICPGADFAVFVYMAGILTLIATANLGKAVDDNGNEIDPVLKTTGRVANLPLAFPFKMTARSEAAKHLLRDAVAMAA